MNISKSKTNLMIKSERSIGILSKVGKNSVLRKSEEINNQPRSQDRLQEQSRKKDASLLERQLSLPCSNFNLHPIALFENVNIETSPKNSGKSFFIKTNSFIF